MRLNAPCLRRRRRSFARESPALASQISRCRRRIAAGDATACGQLGLATLAGQIALSLFLRSQISSDSDSGRKECDDIVWFLRLFVCLSVRLFPARPSRRALSFPPSLAAACNLARGTLAGRLTAAKRRSIMLSIIGQPASLQRNKPAHLARLLIASRKSYKSRGLASNHARESQKSRSDRDRERLSCIAEHFFVCLTAR